MTSKVGKTVVLNVEKAMLDELLAAARKAEETKEPVSVGLVLGCPVWVYPSGHDGPVKMQEALDQEIRGAV